MSRNKITTLLAFLGITGLILSFVFIVILQEQETPTQAPLQPTEKESQKNADPCQPEPGYTQEEWEEHMSHHPDQYKDCLT